MHEELMKSANPSDRLSQCCQDKSQQVTFLVKKAISGPQSIEYLDLVLEGVSVLER